MPVFPRAGRPSLLGLAARTAVFAGTATAVTGGIAAHQQKRARTQYEAAQYEAAQQQAMSPPAPLLQPAPAVSAGDLGTELQKLGALKAQGLLSEAEFETAKTRLLQ